MDQTKPIEAPETAEPSAREDRPKLTMEILIARMMQTQRDIAAYHRGEMSQEEFEALGIKFFT
jgi:hypothetical protein